MIQGLIRSKILAYARNQKFRMLLIPSKLNIFKLQYSFVNLPISSKYYHTPLPQSIDQSLTLAQKEDKLNQKCYLLEHIVQLTQKQPRLLNQRTRCLMIYQLKKWQGTYGRMDKVATVAWVIRKIGEHERRLKNLYQQIRNRIFEDEWYVTMEESIKAMQSYYDTQKGQFKDQLFEKIQRNAAITTGEVNMKYYHRIVVSLIKAERYESPLWSKIQELVIRGLEMNYQPEQIFQIIQGFAISRNGSQSFYEAAQLVLYKGHLKNTKYMFTRSYVGIQKSGEYLALLIETYAIVHKNTRIPLNPDFLDYLYKAVLRPKTEYLQISSLSKLIKNMAQLQFYEDQVEGVISNIIYKKEVGDFKTLGQIHEIYSLLEIRYKKIPQVFHEKIVNKVIKEMNRNTIPLDWSIQAVDFLLQYSQKNHSQNLLVTLKNYYDKKYKYLYIEDRRYVDKIIDNTKLLTDQEQKKLTLPENLSSKK